MAPALAGNESRNRVTIVCFRFFDDPLFATLAAKHGASSQELFQGHF
jgi:hypothetical protein